jgi:hypothetical protein
MCRPKNSNHRSNSLSRRCLGRVLLRLAVLAAVAATAPGCQQTDGNWRQPATPPTPDIADPCAERLHDLCGQLLFYYNARRQLPATLEELERASPGPVPLVCPTCGKPYAYNRDGLEVPESPWRVIVYDAEPCHAGKRWVILLDTVRPGKALVTDVKLFADSPMFAAPPPAATTGSNR